MHVTQHLLGMGFYTLDEMLARRYVVQQLCNAANKRRFDYSLQGYKVDGDHPPKEWSLLNPPWQWTAQFDKKQDVIRKKKIRDMLSGKRKSD
jgi:hypothetical protein